MLKEQNMRRDQSNPSPLAGEVGRGGAPLGPDRRKSKKFLAVLTALLALTISTAALAEDDLPTRDWSVTAARPLDKYAPTTPELEKLLNDAVESNWTMPLCSYKFVDVYDGTFRLVASLDINGRHFCNEVIVIEKTRVGVNILNKWTAVAADNISDMISDLDGDHSPELVITQTWSKAETGRCQATWRALYKWNRGRFTDESVSFSNFYQKRLKQLTNAAAHEADPSCVQMEIDKIARALGSPKAGFDRATGWMKSPTPSLRRKAAAVFADIGDDASKKNLASLAKDGDPLTAETAQLYLSSPPLPR